MKLISFLFICLAGSSIAAAQPVSDNLAVTDVRYTPNEKTVFYSLGEKTLPLKILQYGPGKGIFCINVHDNEQTSVQAAKTILETHGGTLLKIENNGQRIIRFRLRGIVYSFDPNRMFSKTGIEQTLKENGKISVEAIEEIEKFSQRILQLLPDDITCIIALHNNTEEAYSVKSYLKGGDRQNDAKEVYADSVQDVDDIVFTTSKKIFDKMSAQGYNCILQDNENAKKDGSLSVYFGEQNRWYANIETQHGRISQYQEMLEKLLDILTEINKKSSSLSGEDSR